MFNILIWCCLKGFLKILAGGASPFHKPSHGHWIVPRGRFSMGHHLSPFFSFLWCHRTYTFRLNSGTCSDSNPTPIPIPLGPKGVSGALLWRKPPIPMTCFILRLWLVISPLVCEVRTSLTWGHHSQRRCALLLVAAKLSSKHFLCLRVYAAHVCPPQKLLHFTSANNTYSKLKPALDYHNIVYIFGSRGFN